MVTDEARAEDLIQDTVVRPIEMGRVLPPWIAHADERTPADRRPAVNMDDDPTERAFGVTPTLRFLTHSLIAFAI